MSRERGFPTFLSTLFETRGEFGDLHRVQLCWSVSLAANLCTQSEESAALTINEAIRLHLAVMNERRSPRSDFRRSTRPVEHGRILDIIRRGARGRIFGGVP